MYKPANCYKRSPEEKADKFLAWKRDDTAFFAAGACHILAFMFMELHYYEKRYTVIGLKAKQDSYVHHVYVTDGKWAFDYAGWTLEEELVRETTKAHCEATKEGDLEKIVITEDLETFCKQQNHRPPSYFPYLPWERAYNYIQRFDSEPPGN
ncbi:MAG: hypothetical protein ACOCXQ_04710 [Patescibacteria group bacterium]